MAEFYHGVLQILRPYLGTSSEKFLSRQIKYHLKKTPEELDLGDKEELAKWCKVSSFLFLDRQGAPEEIYQKIISLG